ncbi:MAG: protein-disulfide isomerase [Candidatus Vogelbacteria bacterium CG22_combo_CG10-13_8_21_14_all_37_9]|uniref:Protein-disulfide isomerase n=1 Tax=Candidatus Vogelbacteria bacterium CG22_combo_CG10-13_8_21_14_all_37_9 TaxID=1975046 RepID=A0A2H0BKU8_9BACT|nr:MAG: protein-disulfide isomerase [Candidatus Vogelbacteria bacterium CG22_combo_CG10-13_8_21_14_all_37_9]
MNNENLTKYELHQEKKREQSAEGRRTRTWKKMRHLAIWLIVLVILGGIVWLVNSSFAKRSVDGQLPLSSKAKDILKPKADDWIIGDVATAKLILTEYSDFECPACATYHPLTKKLLAEFPDQIAFVYRHYPLPFHLYAKKASIVAEAAGRQGKFWEMTDSLFKEQTRWSKSPKAEAIFNDLALKIGLDLDRFQIDLKDPALSARVERDLAEAKILDVTYTPSFYLGTNLIDNPRSYDEFKSLIQKALSQ